MVSMQGFFPALTNRRQNRNAWLRALLLTAVSECRVGSLSCAHSPALPGGATLAWLFSAELLKCSGCSAPVPKAIWRQPCDDQTLDCLCKLNGIRLEEVDHEEKGHQAKQCGGHTTVAAPSVQNNVHCNRGDGPLRCCICVPSCRTLGT